MARDFIQKFPRTTSLFELAENLTGLPISKYTLRGPFSKLSRTDILQPAITAVNLSYIEYFNSKSIHPMAVAGHSLGEISALSAACVCSSETSLQLSVIRGKLMHQASLESPGGMAAIVGLDEDIVRGLVTTSSQSGSLTIANYNAPGQFAVSGDKAGLTQLRPLITSAGGRFVRLDVSGAWHSEAMRSVQDEWADAVEKCEFVEPRCPLYLNVTGKPAASVSQIREGLIRQLVEPVLWTSIIHGMISSGACSFIEPGPGHVLRNLIRRIHPDPSAYEIFSPGSMREIDKWV